jgi:MFS family permease
MRPSALVDVLRRQRRFRWFFLGMLFSRIGDTFNVVALSWLVLDIAGPRELGAVLFLAGIPGALSAPLAGHLLDRFGARRVVLVENVLRAALVAAIPLLWWTGTLRMGYLYVLVLLGAALIATEIAHDVAIPELVPDGDLEAANTLVSVIWDGSAWVGPALAGLVVQFAGVGVALLVDAATFVVMATTAWALPTRLDHGGGEEREPGGSLGRLLGGFRLLWRLRPVAVMTGVAVGVLLLSGIQEVFMPAYSRSVLGVGAAGYGLIVSVAGFGSLLGTVLLTPLLARLRPGPAVALTVAVRGLFLAPLAVTRSLPVAATTAALSGAADGPFYPLSRSIVQRRVPAELRGRVAGARGAIGAVGYPTGAAVGGLLLGAFRPAVVVAVMVAAHVPLVAAILLTRELAGPPDAEAELGVPAATEAAGSPTST